MQGKFINELDGIWADLRAALTEINAIRGQIYTSETFGGSYGFIEQEEALLNWIHSLLSHYRAMAFQLRNRMNVRIQEYKQNTFDLDSAVQEAARDLPPGYIVNLGMENGAAWIELVKGDETHTIDSVDQLLSEQIREAIACAVRSDKEAE